MKHYVILPDTAGSSAELPHLFLLSQHPLDMLLRP